MNDYDEMGEGASALSSEPALETMLLDFGGSEAAPAVPDNFAKPEFAFSAEVEKRGGGKALTEESFMDDVRFYEQVIAQYSRPDRDGIVGEINNWDFSSIVNDMLTPRKVLQAYTRINRYKWRLAQMLGETKRYHTAVSTAYSTLKDTARKLYSAGSTRLPDTLASALHRMRPLEVELVYVETIKQTIEDTNTTVDKMSINLSAAIKHLDSLVRSQGGYDRLGQSHIYEDMAHAEESDDDQENNSHTPGSSLPKNTLASLAKSEEEEEEIPAPVPTSRIVTGAVKARPVPSNAPAWESGMKLRRR